MLYSFAFLCYAAGSWWSRSGTRARGIGLIVAVALGARLSLLFAAPTLSTDAYRYVWDARVAHAGISPYRYAASSETLAPLRDAEVFPRLNHPTWRTVYPPGAEAFFRFVYSLRPDSVRAMKLAVGLGELIGLAVVFGWLRATERPLSRAIVYAWNPLVLVEVWGSGHLDGLVVPAIVGAAWATMRGRHLTAGALLGVGALLKLYPAALLLLLPLGAWPAAGAGFVVVTLAGYAPAALAGPGVLGSLPRYLAEEYFNIGIVRSFIPSPIISVAAVVAWMIVTGAVRRDRPLPPRAIALIGGALLLGPNIFPWYAIWLLPFLAWSPNAAWIGFTGTIAFAYAFFLRQPWAIPAWARVVEFAPLVAGVVWWLAKIALARRFPECGHERA